MKPKTNFQGTMVVEPNGNEFMVMFPDGTCVPAFDKADVEAKARLWFKKNNNDHDKFNLGLIEWRIDAP